MSSPPTRTLPTRNLRMTVAYDGSNYVGWQSQPNGPSIQAAIEKGIEKLVGHHCPVLAAGRTDSGVHALGQVISFQTLSTIPVGNWPSALQSCLPYDIVIRDAREVPADFHATFSAKRKRYRYVIQNSPWPLPFLRQYVYYLRRELDAEAMHDAAQVLVGKHDFRCFETDWPNKATSVRTVLEVTVQRTAGWPMFAPQGMALPPPDGQLPFITLEIVADGFLYNMVRTITGTLINVGRGKWTRSDIQRILESQIRSAAGSTAPACGLYMVHVDYEGD